MADEFLGIVFEAYIAAYMKGNKCSREVALQHLNDLKIEAQKEGEIETDQYCVGAGLVVSNSSRSRCLCKS